MSFNRRKQITPPVVLARAGARIQAAPPALPSKVSSHPLRDHHTWLADVATFFECCGQQQPADLIHMVGVALEKALGRAAGEDPTISVAEIATEHLKLTPQATTARLRRQGHLMGAKLNEQGRWEIDRSKFLTWMETQERAA